MTVLEVHEVTLTANLARAAHDVRTQAAMVPYYAAGVLMASFARAPYVVDWATVNGLLLQRWKPSGLKRIKLKAWQRASAAARATRSQGAR